MRRTLLLPCVCGVLLAAAARADDRRTVEIGGQAVTLTVAKDVILVQPKDPKLASPTVAPAEAKKFLTEVVNGQGELLPGKTPPKVALDEVQRTPPRRVPQLGSLLAPRAVALDAANIHRLSEAPEVSSANAVYRFNGQLIIPRPSVTVRFHNPPAGAVVAAAAAKFQLKVLERPTHLPNLVQFGLGAPEKADAFRMAELLRVEFGATARWVEADLIRQVNKNAHGAAPADPFEDQQWYLKTIRAEAFWRTADPKTEILVAVFDDGVDGDHEDLAGRVVHGRNYVAVPPNAIDPNAWRPQDPNDNHGTPCAGLIAAVAGNGKGIAGIGRGVKVVPIRVTGANMAADGDVARAFDYAREKKVRVISFSLGYDSPPTKELTDAIAQWVAGGGLLVAAAGNSGPNANVCYPASVGGCIAVGATDPNDELWPYSCRGPNQEVTLVAPSGLGGFTGVHGVWSTDRARHYGANPGGDPNAGWDGWLPHEKNPADRPPGLQKLGDADGHYTGRFGGTSAAAPQVAAVAATIWACYPHLTAAQVKKALIEGADKVRLNDPFAGYQNGYSKLYGYGRLNAWAALLRASAMPAPGAASVPPRPTGPVPPRPTASVPPRATTPAVGMLPRSTGPLAVAPKVGTERSAFPAGGVPLTRSVTLGGAVPRPTESVRPATTDVFPAPVRPPASDLVEIAPAPIEIAAQPPAVVPGRDSPENRVAAILKPQPLVWDVDGKKMTGYPCNRWVVVSAPVEMTPSVPEVLARIMRPEVASDRAFWEHVKTSADGRFATYKVALTALRSADELVRLARAGTLPAIYPVYDCKEGEVVFSGTIEVPPAADAARVAKAADELKLKPVGRPGGERGAHYQFTTPTRDARNPAEAARALAAKAGTTAKPTIVPLKSKR